MHECTDPVLVDKNPNKASNRFVFPYYHETRDPQCGTLYSLIASRFAKDWWVYFVSFILDSYKLNSKISIKHMVGG